MTVAKKYLPTHIQPQRGKRAPAAATRGIYVSAFYGSDVWGFPKNNSGNGPATCTVPVTPTGVNSFGVDNSGTLIVPDGFSGTFVYSNSSMCGTQLGTISDPYGQPSDAAAVDAVNGTIALGNIFDNSDTPGSISLCTLSSGTCSTNLTNPNIFEMGGVAMSSNGDCWADAINESDIAVLVYFQGCSGAGVLTTGFSNGFYGGLDIDKKGNLVTTSLFGPSFSLPSTVNVYSGCNPACTLLSSTPLAGESIFGHVGRQGLRYVTTDLETAATEVYAYKPTGLTLLYSFTGGIPCASDECEAAAYTPSTNK
ncbi:MAG TPA: hypothetical protein VGG51_04045 [Candidatus Cybelea sp.]|jgi:hypothetical protein